MQGLCQRLSGPSDPRMAIARFGVNGGPQLLTFARVLIACTRLVVPTATVPLPNKEPRRSKLIAPLSLGVAPHS